MSLDNCEDHPFLISFTVISAAVDKEFMVCSIDVFSSAATEPPGLLPPPSVLNEPVPW